MGIILKQSSINTVIIFIAFAIGGINTLFLYTNFLTPERYGLVVFLLSAANLLMPLTAFGVQYTIVKFFSSYQTKFEKDRFLSMAIILPLFIALPIGFLVVVFYEKISIFLSTENTMIKDYTYIIYLVAVATAYFEVFYAWAKVQMQSTFGNAIRELFSRILILILLILVSVDVLDGHEFILYLTALYFLRMLIMMLYAFKLYTPKFTFSFPENIREIISYSAYIILAGSAGAILLDIDKVMLPQKEAIELAAFYTVGVFIASVVEAPGRAMLQIVQPLTSKAINEKNTIEIASLYKRTSVNLFIVCGLFFYSNKL
jgi:O-antigen/teichoic acid export membrane protein